MSMQTRRDPLNPPPDNFIIICRRTNQNIWKDDLASHAQPPIIEGMLIMWDWEL